MGLFSTSSPFDADVDKATDEKNTTEEWSGIMEICDKVGSSPQNAKDCLRSIVRRLNNQDPHIVVQAITLLDACVNNCGKSFHLEVASRDFETELRKLLTKSQPKVAEKLRQLIKKWAEGEFKTDPQLGLIPSLYAKLKTEGHDFSSMSDPSSKQPRSSMPKDPNAVSSQQEVDDIAKAIELSLKETQASPKSTVLGGSSGGGTSLYPSASLGVTTTAPPHSQETRKVRALYDFEAVEDNELTFVAGEIVHLLDDSDPNWWKGYNQRGEGLFPANFVTSDLSVEPEKKEPRKSIQFNEVVRVKTIKPEQVEIEEDKIDKLLHMLHEADPTDLENDPEELIQLEEQVNAMGPLIDSELEQVDRKHAQLTQVSSGLVEALNLYHMLMREPSHAPKPYVPFSPPPHPMYTRMSGPPFPMGPGPGPGSSQEYMMVGPPPPQGPYSMQGFPVSRPEDMQGPPSLPQPQQSIPYPNCYGPPFPGSGAPPVQPMPPPGGPFPPNGQSL